METPVIVALIAAVVAGLGWVVSYIVTSITDRRRQIFTAKLEFTTKQLEELYGPLYVLLVDSDCTYDELLKVLNIQHKANEPYPNEDILFPEGACSPIANDKKKLEIWLFWVEHDFFPRNEKIKELISSKTYLIDDSTIPQTFKGFLAHYSSWKIKHERWKEKGVIYNWHSETPWPQNLKKDVEKKLYALKKQHTDLLRKANVSQPTTYTGSKNSDKKE